MRAFTIADSHRCASSRTLPGQSNISMAQRALGDKCNEANPFFSQTPAIKCRAWNLPRGFDCGGTDCCYRSTPSRHDHEVDGPHSTVIRCLPQLPRLPRTSQHPARRQRRRAATTDKRLSKPAWSANRPRPTPCEHVRQTRPGFQTEPNGEAGTRRPLAAYLGPRSANKRRMTIETLHPPSFGHRTRSTPQLDLSLDLEAASANTPRSSPTA